MAAFLPASVFGLRVPAGGMPVPVSEEFPATIRITMAAIDPTAAPQLEEGSTAIRSTLKLIREADDDEDDEDFDDIEAIKARLAGVISESESEDDEESEEEANGGPSDPAKTKKARKEAMIKALKEQLEDEMELDEPNGKSKGKARADDDEESESDEDSEMGEEMEEFVLCTLDPERNYQQPIDITIGEHERVYFSSNGTHDIYITGNYVLPPDEHDHDHDEESDEEDEYDLSPDEDELDGLDDEDEEDELDGMADPRVTELDSDEEEAPKLVKADKKTKNKRPADDSEGETLDDLINNSKSEAATNGEQKLSKKQAKKLKKNDGAAAAVPEPVVKKDQKETNGEKKDKKVQFAKNLELGPTGSPKVEEKKEAAGPKVVNGVTIDDKKVGKGPAAKKGNKIELRYIGKLKNGRQFDANKKGKPFSFKVGSGEVIKGMDIGVVGLTVGGERRIIIPAKLAYGNKALPDIPANSDLIFDLKCLAIH
ncbi:hypothetical protein GQ43DRAFT_440729 [Delitschia confertaspora ATCC 74209]|uniref:FK506-binding protein n=1 Tax=Delitschia confertaspora ATCC 74209 TaxID=1513339 RepID=A0A9P4JN45_9PLEO|nr:hypothetical protein GQ43DRAFT_440729 [Delitschia confertaspora ATCC 74209]